MGLSFIVEWMRRMLICNNFLSPTDQGEGKSKNDDYYCRVWLFLFKNKLTPQLALKISN